MRAVNRTNEILLSKAALETTSGTNECSIRAETFVVNDNTQTVVLTPAQF